MGEGWLEIHTCLGSVNCSSKPLSYSNSQHRKVGNVDRSDIFVFQSNFFNKRKKEITRL